MNPKTPKLPKSTSILSHHPDSNKAVEVPRPVSAFARKDKAGHVIKRHFHERDQLIYAIRGVMTIEALGSIWTIPSNYSLWIPALIEHSVKMNTAVEMRTLYLQPGIVNAPFDECQVRAVSPLLRELIVRSMTIPPLYNEKGSDGRLMRVIVDEINQQQKFPFSLKIPADRRLEKIARHLLDSLSESEPITELGQRVGLSERSIIRLFPLETGLTLHSWRQQAKLMKAFVMGEQGKHMGVIAQELGYSSTSAFAKMFRKMFNQSPSEVL
jgi:AraC-like DNA-binding protein